MFRYILSLILLSPLAFTQNLGKPLQTVHLEKADGHYLIKIKPNKDHHFNLEAPTRVLNNGQIIKPTSMTPSQLTLSVAINGKCEYQFQTYVCDDKKTFCAPQKSTVSCDALKKTSTKPEFIKKNSLEVSLGATDEKPQSTSEKTAKTSTKHTADIFIDNDPRMALDLAKKTGRPLFIDFYGTWCPPCNILDETVFNTPDFIKNAKKFVLLKLDADDKTSWELKSKYSVTGYPTIVLATADAEEITRFMGAIPQPQIIKMMKDAEKNKTISLKTKMDRYFTTPNPHDAIEIIDSLVYNEKYADTVSFIPEAQKLKDPTLAQKELLEILPLLALKAEINDQLKKNIPKLKESFETYPVSDIYPAKLQQLIDISTNMKDDELKKWVHETNLKNLDSALKKKTNLNTLTKLDLLYYRSASFSALEQPENEKKVRAEMVREYDLIIKQNKQNPKTNRGYNLERIYSIYKSGDVQKARDEYQKLISVYPHEFTFHYDYASVLKDLNDLDEALKHANNALSYSYGDNQLRSIQLVSEIEYKKGNKKDPLERLTKTIQSTELPKDESNRTHRYVKRLIDLKKKIEDGKTI